MYKYVYSFGLKQLSRFKLNITNIYYTTFMSKFSHITLNLYDVIPSFFRMTSLVIIGMTTSFFFSPFIFDLNIVTVMAGGTSSWKQTPLQSESFLFEFKGKHNRKLMSAILPWTKEISHNLMRFLSLLVIPPREQLGRWSRGLWRERGGGRTMSYSQKVVESLDMLGS